MKVKAKDWAFGAVAILLTLLLILLVKRDISGSSSDSQQSMIPSAPLNVLQLEASSAFKDLVKTNVLSEKFPDSYYKNTTNQVDLSHGLSETGLPVFWELELGIFNSEEEAQKLAKDIRSGGFKVFVEEISVNDTNYSRVLLGPKLKKQRILIDKESIEKRYNVDPKVLQYVHTK